LQQQLVGTDVDRLSHELVLQPHQTVTQLCRMDQGPLAQTLSGSPVPALQVTFDVRTNPSTTGFGPAGQLVNFNKFVERENFPLIPASFTQLALKFQQGGPAEKIRSVDLAYALGNIFSQQQQQQQNNQDIKQTVMQIVDWLKTAGHDSSNPVQAWANSVLVRFAQPSDRPQLVSHMVNDPYWGARLLGVAGVTSLPGPDQQKLLDQLIAHETDPVVHDVAKYLKEVLAENGPTTQPTTAPASGTISSTAPTSAPADKPAVVIPTLPPDVTAGQPIK
jgi:hypothetical protein